MFKFHPAIHIHLNKNLKELYIFDVLRFFSLATISLFIPAYILFDLQAGLAKTLLFLIILYISFSINSYTAGQCLKKYNPKTLLALSSFIQITAYLLLYHVDKSGTLLYVTGALLGLGNAFFWLCYHSILATITIKKYRGEELSIENLIRVVVTISGPFIGGIIITTYGFHILFIIAACCMISSLIPLSALKIKKPRVAHLNKNPISVRDMGALFGNAILQLSEAIFWPLYLFTLLSSYLGLGGVISGASLVSGIYVLFIGKLSDRHKKKWMIKWSTIIDSLLIIPRLLVRSVTGILV